MIIVSDTSPVSALLTIGEIGLLEKLFGEVVIPAEVLAELRRSFPKLPSFLQIKNVQNFAQVYFHAVRRCR
jgi:predicted nucleic acid-binding protein